MLFTPWGFVFFFVIVYLAYLRLDRVGQNRLLLASGLFFYGSFDWRFLFLLLRTPVGGYSCRPPLGEATTPPRGGGPPPRPVRPQPPAPGVFYYLHLLFAAPP